MGARKKLNEAAVMGAIVIGALAGIAMHSFAVFIVVTVLLLAAAVYGGDIR